VARQLAVDGPGQTLLRLAPGREDLLPATVPVRTMTRATVEPPPARAPEETVRLRKPSEVSEDELLAALRENRWNLKATAAALGVARTSLYILLEQSTRVRAAADVPPEEVRAAFERCGGDIETTAADLEISERALRQRLKDLGLR
jgi:two-component system nitrogen regulation response regulator GlnG